MIEASIRDAAGVAARHEARVDEMEQACADTTDAQALLTVFQGALECQQATRVLLARVVANAAEFEGAVVAGGIRRIDVEWLDLQSRRHTARDAEDAAHDRLFEAITSGIGPSIDQAAAASLRAEAESTAANNQVLAHLDRRTRDARLRFERALAFGAAWRV